ncbi:helix-turn-helix domain-containing protein [Zobellia sp. B3R18]|uniref:helix-turn-helix domain-containing protein n=1 Tax=Zobellia sp. B3R18 TaxID=2841568 RepID=UPI001C07B361|nr:helix-turn-helix domain-containing protein [Zobellia sp. B3R18]MBU2974979.1 helix-turn-helix domain-containing protein [Zobellia sp. B3R18]
MNNQPNTIDWNSPEMLLNILNSIKTPLSSIMEANNRAALQILGDSSKENVAKITLENSQKIAALIEEIIKKSSANTNKPARPLIFDLYENNINVQEMCSGEVDPKKISQTDKAWLLDLEKVVFNEPNPDQLSLFALAFEVSVSERQLHRNIKKFLSLTPNKYIRILKLHKAKNLLEEYTYRTISEVAYAVGFQDAHYFSKLFYKQYGKMPKDLIPA